MNRARVDEFLNHLEATSDFKVLPWQRQILYRLWAVDEAPELPVLRLAGLDIHRVLSGERPRLEAVSFGYTPAAVPTDETPLLTKVLLVLGVSLLAWGSRNAVRAIRRAI